MSIIKRFVGFTILIAVILCPLTSMTGCNDAPIEKVADSTQLPQPPGQAFLVKSDNGTPIKINLERLKRTFEASIAKGTSFFSQDLLSNLSQETLQMTNEENGWRLALKPGIRVQLDQNSLVLFEGAAQFEFRKVGNNFKVKIPGAQLGIRGTRFDVTLAPDHSARVVLYEGKVAIERSGKEDILEPGQTALIGADGNRVEIGQTPADLPAMFQGLPPEKAKETVR
ncbi:MAG: FecR domain-containing protein [Candidatus Riflebacteria bacterium]|nr:FecR domain-containing protein [Candidatus Riflebacteria bacterium]